METAPNIVTDPVEAAVWAAIDDVAERASLTVSALAVKADLDATIFNKSKRHGRAPNFRSVIKACRVAGIGMGEFGALVDQHATGGANV